MLDHRQWRRLGELHHAAGCPALSDELRSLQPRRRQPARRHRGTLASGVIGVKIHEDLGATPALIDTCLGVADRLDFQVQLHTDSMNESGFYETTMEAIAGVPFTCTTPRARWRTCADIIRCNGERHCLPSSTTPTNPFTLNALGEHMDMMMLCHTLRGDVPEDVAFAESRLRPNPWLPRTCCTTSAPSPWPAPTPRDGG